MIYFLDTNICIFFLKNKFPKIAENLKHKKPDQIKISAIVAGELRRGALRSSNFSKVTLAVEQFIASLEVIPFCSNCSIQWAGLREELEKKGQMIGPYDSLIAATVLEHRGTLVTHNTKEFKRVKGLSFEDWAVE
jgi:tRNA(fMet)-specific endonuclease VapC